jgi:hypothetical protein
MSLYCNPNYFQYKPDLSAPEESSMKIDDLDAAFKHVLQGNNWNELNVRK